MLNNAVNSSESRARERRWNNTEQWRKAKLTRAIERRWNIQKTDSENYKTSQVNSRLEILQPRSQGLLLDSFKNGGSLLHKEIYTWFHYFRGGEGVRVGSLLSEGQLLLGVRFFRDLLPFWRYFWGIIIFGSLRYTKSAEQLNLGTRNINPSEVYMK